MTSVAFSLLISVVTLQLEPERCWGVDKTTVMAGGCLTLLVTEACGSRLRLTLQIDEREPVALRMVAPQVQEYTGGPLEGSTTLFLISHDTQSAKSYEPVAGEPEVFQMVGIFGRPGTVRLTLRRGDEDLGYEDIVVIPTSSRAQKTVELLYPEFERNKGPSYRPASVWMGLAVTGITYQVGDINVEELRAELPELTQHPDWKDILEMRVARLEALVHTRALRRLVEKEPNIASSEVVIPNMPTTVLRAASRKVDNMFARSLQVEVRLGMTASDHILKEVNLQPADGLR